MSAIKTHHLEHLGFEQVNVSEEESGDNSYFYFTKDLSLENSSFCLLSCGSDERVDDNWRIYIMDCPEYEITNYNCLVVLLEALNANITLKTRETNNFNLI